MISTRRTLMLGIGAAAFSGSACAQRLRNRVGGGDTSPPVSGPYAAAADYSAKRRGVSLLVMQAGRIVLETYPDPGGPTNGWELASGTKSFTGVMAGLARLTACSISMSPQRRP